MRPFLSGLLSLVFPGAGQVYAGRIGRGLAIAALAASAVVLAAWFAGREALADHVVSLDVLLGLLVANALVLFVRFWIVADAYVLAAREQRRALGRPNALVAALSLLVLGVLTAAPHTVLGWGTYVTYDTIDTVFADEEPQDVLSPAELAFLPTLVPGTSQALHGDRPVAPPDPEPESRKWTTVLLVGGDAGYLRVGLRADTMIAVSIQENTGRAALFSIPRNLDNVPLVGKAREAYDRFPDILNALYRFAQARPELFPGGRDPGATALKQTVSGLLGIPVHYYVMVDLRGFVEVVDALGGIRMIAPDTVDDLTSPAYPGEPWTDIQVTEGAKVSLDGRHALAYARSRSASSDYTRMTRQRCILAAMADRIGSMRVVRSLARLSDVAKTYVSTDIPRQRLPDLVDLLRGIDPSRTLAVSFTPPAYSVVEPDVAAYRATARRMMGDEIPREGDDGFRAVAGACDIG
jgi:polyisoprenyl-teichoic acid--peptidoglycan teichoic acid transferase